MIHPLPPLTPHQMILAHPISAVPPPTPSPFSSLANDFGGGDDWGSNDFGSGAGDDWGTNEFSTDFSNPATMAAQFGTRGGVEGECVTHC